MKLSNRLEDMKVSLPYTKSNAKIAYNKIYLFLKYYFASQQNNPDPGFQ